jgi:hypothetical protein
LPDPSASSALPATRSIAKRLSWHATRVIKVTAFKRRLTVADMLRDLLAREFPAIDGGQT